MIREIVTQLVVGEIVTQQNFVLGNCHTTCCWGKLSHNTTCDGEIVTQVVVGEIVTQHNLCWEIVTQLVVGEIVTQHDLLWGNCHTTQLVIGEIVT